MSNICNEGASIPQLNNSPLECKEFILEKCIIVPEGNAFILSNDNDDLFEFHTKLLNKLISINTSIAAKEPALGNPPADNYVLSSLIDGTRSWVAPGGGVGSGGHTIQEDGVSLPSRTYLNFSGTAITATDSPGTDSTVVSFAALANIVEDLTPQLGGNLDLNGNIITGLEIGVDVQGYSAVLAATTASFTTADETKLDGIEAGATANSPDATLLDRANHTGTQLASTISDFSTAVAATASVTANTAKISADGSINTHSDVDTTGWVQNYVLKFDAFGNLVPSADTASTSLINLTDVIDATDNVGFALLGTGAGFASRAITEADISDLGNYVSIESANVTTTDWSILNSEGSGISYVETADAIELTGGTAVNQTSLIVAADQVSVSGFSNANIDSIGADALITKGYADANYVTSAPSLETQDEGISVATGVTILNFVGSGVVATDAGGGQVDVTISSGGDALTANPLSQFAATTSVQLAGVISDEIGTGSLVFNTNTTLVTPNLGVPTAIDLTNATNVPAVEVVGNLSVNNFNSGTGASISSYLRGDGTWSIPDFLKSDTTGIPGSFKLNNFIGINQADYDALGSYDSFTYYLIADAVDPSVPVSNTGTVIDLSTTGGNYMHMASASATTTYTIANATLGGWAMVRINAASQPSVTGATLIAGAPFSPLTNMYMVVFHNGTATQYYFLTI